MVAGEEDVGDLEAAEVDGLGVSGGLEELGVAEGFVLGGAGVAECSRKEACDGIAHHGGSNGPIGENVVADGKFEVDEFVDDAMIDPFVVSAEKNEMGLAGKILRDGLLEDFSLRGEKDDFAIRAAQFLDGGKDGVGLEEHPLPATAEVVIGLAVFVGGPVPEVVTGDGDDLGGPGAFDDALIERGERDLGEESENVDGH